MFTHTCYKLFILNMCLIMATIVNLTQISRNVFAGRKGKAISRN